MTLFLSVATVVGVIFLGAFTLIVAFVAWAFTVDQYQKRQERRRLAAAQAQLEAEAHAERVRLRGEFEAANAVWKAWGAEFVSECERLCREDVSRRKHPSWRPED